MKYIIVAIGRGGDGQVLLFVHTVVTGVARCPQGLTTICSVQGELGRLVQPLLYRYSSLSIKRVKALHK